MFSWIHRPAVGLGFWSLEIFGLGVWSFGRLGKFLQGFNASEDLGTTVGCLIEEMH